MRVVGAARAERALDQHAAVDVVRPRFGKRERQREQDRAACERQPCGAGAQRAAARVDDERARGVQRFDILERATAARGRPRRGAQRGGRARRWLRRPRPRARARAHVRRLRARGRAPRAPAWCAVSATRAPRRRARPRRAATGQRRSRRCGRARLSASSRRPSSSSRRTAIRRAWSAFARSARASSAAAACGQVPRRAAEVAHGQRHFGFRNDAAGARELLARAEAAGGAPQQIARERVIAKLRHRDAAQRERRSVVAQRDELECAERVAAGQRARGRGDDGIHGARLPRRAAREADCAEPAACGAFSRLRGTGCVRNPGWGR